MKISRRHFVAGLGAAAVGGGLGYRAWRRSNRPNIILFLADDMRFDATGYLGNTLIKTPVLDALSKESFVFKNSFVTTSICPISRASILSGQYSLRHGVKHFNNNMNAGSFDITFPVLMREAGYYTGYVGKWGFGSGPRDAFDQWHGYDGHGKHNRDYFAFNGAEHLTDLQTGKATEFLNRRPRDQPFLLIVGYKAPHDPLHPQKRYLKMYDDVTIPRVATDTPDALHRLPPPLLEDKGEENYRQFISDDGNYETTMRRYYALITGIDESVGSVLDALGNDREKTSVFFTSDNGFIAGDHGLFGKSNMYEPSIRVPLLIQPARALYPQLRPATVDGMALNIDYAPTMLSQAGIPTPAAMQGMNLMKLMNDHNAPWREGFYYEHPSMRGLDIVPCRGYRTAEWKYTSYYNQTASFDCLFNLKDDPDELNNLINEKPRIAADMRSKTLEQEKLLS